MSSGRYIVCTRYKILTELRNLFKYNTVAELRAYQKKSDLFPNVSPALLKKLRNRQKRKQRPQK